MSRAEGVKSWRSWLSAGSPSKGISALRLSSPRCRRKWRRGPQAHGAHSPLSEALPALRTPEAQFRSLWMKRVADAIFRPLLKDAGDVATAGDARKCTFGLARVGGGGAKESYKDSP